MQNVENAALPRKRSTFCTVEVQNVDRRLENGRISTFYTLPRAATDTLDGAAVYRSDMLRDVRAEATAGAPAVDPACA